jgi:hypothetical protein
MWPAFLHEWRRAGGDVDDASRSPLDVPDELAKQPDLLRRPSVLRVSGVQVHDRGACFDGADGGFLDFIGTDRQMGRHGRRAGQTGG